MFTISHKSLPTRLPFTFTVSIIYLADRFNISQIWWGVLITILAIFWAGAVYRIIKEKRVSLFGEEGKDGRAKDVPFIDLKRQSS